MRGGTWRLLLPLAGVVVLLVAFFLPRGRHDLVPVRPAPPTSEAAPPPPAGSLPPPAPPEPGRTFRVRRPGGRIETASAAELKAAVERARTDFEVARRALSLAFARKERELGPEAAWQVLEGALRRPLTSLDARAEAYEAAFLLASVYGSASEGKKGPRDYAPMIPAMLAQVRSTLLDPSADAELQRVFLAALGGVRSEFHFEVREVGTVDGEPLKDLADAPAVYLLTDSPLLTPGSAPRTTAGIGPLADTLWTLAGNRAAPPLVRSGALLALGSSAAQGPRDSLIVLARDEDSDVRRSAIYLLTLRTDALSAPEFLSILDAQSDPLGRSLAVRSLSGALAGDPRVREVLVREATAPVPADGVTTPQYFERKAALVAVLEGYAVRRDPESLEALAPHVDRWAREVWKSASPLVLLAEEASRLGLKEFLPYLRAASPLVPAEDDRRRVEAAVAALGEKK